MVNTTRASMCSQIAELVHFGIITKSEEQVCLKRIDDWDRMTKMSAELSKVANEVINEVL